MRNGIVLGVLLVRVMAVAAEKDPAFDAAKTSFQREMKKKSAHDRAAAVSAIAAFRRPEVAQLLLKRGLIDTDADVRIAVRRALRKIADEPAGRAYLLTELQKSRKRTGADELLSELWRALTPVDDPACRSQVAASIDEYLAGPKANWLVPMSVIDEFGQQGDADAVRALETFAQAKARSEKFGYQRSIVQAAIRIRQPATIGFLIDFLPRTEGIIQLDVVMHLARFTRQPFRGNDAEWQKWWSQNVRTFKFPDVDPPQTEFAMLEGQPMYYRLPICAKRVVFVLDTSGSMRGAPIDAAQRALVTAVEALPEAVAFNVVLFSSSADAVRPRLIPATREYKQEATRAVRARPASGGTSSNAALQLAFGMEPEVIYFLSDGEPTDANGAQIVDTITALNRTRRVSVFAIGVLTNRGNAIGLTQFMQPLAERNWGTFQLVE